MNLNEPVLDHVVVLVHERMDEALARYQSLGFGMTPRGHHTLGSINHLAIFRDNYLELLGVEPGRSDARPDLREYSAGLNSVVFATDDADAVYQGLTARGIRAQSPADFSRPVLLEGALRDARFRTVWLEPGVTAFGRIYFCQHLTKELVLREEWQHHPNGACAISRVVIASDDPDEQAELFRSMFGREAVQASKERRILRARDFAVEIATPHALADEFDGTLPQQRARHAMVALSLRTRSLDATQSALARGGIEWKRPNASRLLVPASESMNVTLEFVS